MKFLQRLYGCQLQYFNTTRIPKTIAVLTKLNSLTSVTARDCKVLDLEISVCGQRPEDQLDPQQK